MAKTVGTNPQQTFDEVVLMDADAEAMLDDFLTSRQEAGATKKAHDANKKRIELLVDKEGWKNGQIIRIGPHNLKIDEMNESDVPGHHRGKKRRIRLVKG